MPEEETKEAGQRLDVAGTYQVAILDEPKWYQMPEKDGDTARMVLRLRGYINGGEQDGKWIDADLMFIRTIISGGRDKGRSMFEVQAEKCISLGMSEPFSPSKVGEIVGAACEFVCDWDEFEDRQGNARRVLRVQFVNTHSRPPLAVDEAEKIWQQLQEDSGLGDDIPGSDLDGGTGLDDAGLGIDPDDNLPGLESKSDVPF